MSKPANTGAIALDANSPFTDLEVPFIDSVPGRGRFVRPPFEEPSVLPSAGNEEMAGENRSPAWALSVVLGALVLAASVSLLLLFQRVELLFEGSSLARVLLVFAALGGTALVCVRTALWLRYSPMPALPDAKLPTVSVVIPAYQEGEGVRVAIESALASRYPADKLEVICVDDGSSDDTFSHVVSACAQDPRATAHRLPENRGKRHALHAGFVRAKGDVIVTLDSDSQMLSDTLRALVSPLAKGRVGAVAGRVLVRNRKRNVLTRMLWVQYVVGFDFTRAYQSVIGTVFCVPGACAAYRRRVVEGDWLAWRDQTFLGANCNNGDDHHMTTLVLRRGYDVEYQSSASIYTEVPGSYKRLTKMFTRWARSNIRESFIYMGFAVRRARLTGQALPLVDGTVKVVSNVLRPVMFLAPLVLLFANPGAFLLGLVAVASGSLLYSAYYLRFDKSLEVLYGVVYGLFSFFALSWIYPYAFATVRKNGWLTR